jgi:hypothetical protein
MAANANNGEARPPLVLHVDINKTLIICDPVR